MNIGKRHENLILTLCTLILVGLGAVMVYSASSVTAEASERLGHDAAYYFKRQVLFIAPALIDRACYMPYSSR